MKIGFVIIVTKPSTIQIMCVHIKNVHQKRTLLGIPALTDIQKLNPSCVRTLKQKDQTHG